LSVLLLYILCVQTSKQLAKARKIPQTPPYESPSALHRQIIVQRLAMAVAWAFG